MDYRFYTIFENLQSVYLDLLRPQTSPLRLRFRSPRFVSHEPIPAVLSELIDRTLESLSPGQALRPDAKLFLLINLHLMVVVPLSQEVRALTLVRMLEHDVRTVLGRALEIVPASAELSSHAIMLAVIECWPKLEISSLNIWG